MRILLRFVLALALGVGGVGVVSATPASAATVVGADYAWFRPSINQLNHPNIGGAYVGWVARYVGSGSSGKRLSVAERNWLTKTGVWKGVVFNSEGTGHEVTGGYAAGRAQALAAWRDPAYVHGYPLILSIDFDFGGSPVAYLNGAASVIGKGLVGVYAGVRVVQSACNAGFRGNNWQTYAWSGGRWVSGSCAPIRQVHNGALWGGQGDLDLQAGPYRFYGPGSRPAPAPSPAPKPSPKPPVVVHKPAPPVAHHPVPAPVLGASYRVVRGDTLSRIAARFRVSGGWPALARRNHLRNPNRINVGQVLRLR